MGRKILVILFIIFKTGSVFGAERIAGNSAYLKNSNIGVFEYTKKKKTVERILTKYQSPLVKSVDAFIDVCDNFKYDCYLLPSIAGLESRFGHYIYPNSYNPFGWGGGYIMFKDWNQAIKTVGSGLGEKYIDKGATTVEQIGRIYAESPTWAQRVRGFMREFEIEEEKNKLSFSVFELQL